MEIEIIKDISTGIGEERRNELEHIAASHYDNRITFGQMLERIRKNNASLKAEEMLFVISTLRKMIEEAADSTAPLIHEVRMDDSNMFSFTEMQATQFAAWDDSNPLYVKILVENPNYRKANVGFILNIDLEVSGKAFMKDIASGEVRLGKDEQFGIVTYEILRPYSSATEEFMANECRIFIHEQNEKKILASADFSAITVRNDFPSYLKIRENYIFNAIDHTESMISLKSCSHSEVGFRMKFQQQFAKELEGKLPEIEVSLFIGNDDSYGFMTRKVTKAKPYRENGETVYIAEDIFFNHETCENLKDGKYLFAIHIWGHAILDGSFFVGDSPLSVPVLRDYVNGDLYESVGSKYSSNKAGSTSDETPKETVSTEETRRPHEHIVLSSLNLYKQTVIDNYKEGDDLDGQTTFKEGMECDIYVYSIFDYVKDEFKNPAKEKVTYCLYDNTGRLLQTVEGTQSSEDGGEGKNIFLSIGQLSPQNSTWEKGTYRIEASLWNEIIISIKFDVCDKENFGMFDPAGSQPRINQGGRKIVSTEYSDARKELEELIGLQRIKEKIDALKEVNQFGLMRQKAGLSYKRQSLHACFIGGAGTGKTTVAGLIGQIYKEMGLLSKGHVVYEERSTLIGRYYDSELRETERALRNAEGGILFIDEAYSLYVEEDQKDPGHKVLEALLTALSDEKNRDWMLVLAGYPDQMEKMLNSNQGLKSRVSDVFYFDDMSKDELLEVADLYCRKNEFILTPEARRALESVIAHDYASKTKSFGNARYVNNLLEKQVVPAMANRLCKLGPLSKKQLMTIEKEDIPAKRRSRTSKKMDRLNKMVGLESLKQNISKHLNFVQMVNNRMNHGLHTSMPPLHMIFTGNPGTGKSTVADFMGEIYASIGVLSHGEVIKVERRDLVGQHIGETEQKMNEIIERAKGNVLFIDEAYQLWVDDSPNDFGKIAVEALLGVMANDQLDMIVILAGYTKEMEKLIEMNSGLKSRFPYTFHFEDYTSDELLEIAELTIAREKFVLSPEARKRFAALIKKEVSRKQASFGNGRFVNRLISTKILPAMAGRLAEMEETPDQDQLITIVEDDIPISADEATRIEMGSFDEKAITAALESLDAMVGLKYVKKTIHNFVETSRYANTAGRQMFGDQVMKWNFIGNTGTGKSTIARIMAEILKAMGLIGSSEVVEVKGEELYNVPEYRCDEILRKAMEKAKYGLIFVDSDAPMFRNAGAWALTGDQLRIKLATLTAEIGGNGAIIIAECESSRPAMGPSLAKKGVFGIDRTLVFEDYTAEELFQILALHLKKQNAEFSEEAASKMRSYLTALCDNRSLEMANARTMQLLSQSILQIVLLRESQGDCTEKSLVTASDVESFEWHKPYKKIGF